MRRTITFLGLLSLIAGMGCSSTGGVRQYQKDEILSTSGDKPMPEWAEVGETKPFRIEDGKVHSVGIAYIRGDEIPSSGARISANNARASIAKAVENRMEFIFQQGSENFSYDSQVAKFIGSEVASMTMGSLREEGMWWKRVAQSDEDGSRRIRYVIYSLVTCPEKDFQAAIFKAANKAVTEKKVSPEFQKQLSQQWNNLTDSPARDTASEKTK